MKGKFKNICKLMCMILAVLLVSACAFDDKSADDGETERTVEDSSVNETDSESQPDSELPFSSAEESYKEILLGNEDFISTDLQNRSLHLSDIKDVITDDDSITVTIPQFAIIDLDTDGENEVVLWIQIKGADDGFADYGFEILRYQEGAVYGYTLPYRAFINLKTDGTFMYSGSAADFGIGKLKFSENGYIVDKLYYSESVYDSNNELSVQYFANGIACTEEEWTHIAGSQEEKNNVNWYSLTDDSINSVFASGF